MDLSRHALVLVTGKGGVGKTTVAAALAHALEACGRRVLLLESDPRESAHELLDVAPSGGRVVEVGERLHLLDLPPRRAADRVLEQRIAVPGVMRRLREKELYRHFVDGCPGLGEMALLETARFALAGEGGLRRVDVVVVDAPASGHGSALLRAPEQVAGAVGGGPIARAASGLADLVSDPAKTAIVVVTLAEEMAVTESLELRAALREDPGVDVALLAVNALLPNVEGVRGLSDWRRSEPAVDLWVARRAMQDAQLARLAEEWTDGRVELPVLSERGVELVQSLASRLAGAGASEAWSRSPL
ncbi:MAG TPA: ArsA-related P-loop ATPase [Thermoanaerobaculia bacterium]|nr:ArsA-related P-loop ATPase [Thermoanaerobaculia bacterium]